MNFDEIKSALENDSAALKVPISIAELKKSEMPIQMIRKRMKSEIVTQLLCILIFFAIPIIIKMHKLPRAVYFIFMFLTALITIGYLIKMIWFLRKTSNIKSNTKETLLTFMNDIQLTMEVYKTAIIAGSLLLPVALLALFLGKESADENVFNKLFLLDISAGTILIVVLIYIMVAFFFYKFTERWADIMYGNQLTYLKRLLKSLEE